MKSLALCIFFWGSVMFAQFFPMIQTHSFEMEPFLKNTQGYAFFISSPMFSGKEVITVKAPADTLLPDINMKDRVLNQYSERRWHISDQDRVFSAQGGALPEGTYTFEIKTETEKYTLDFDYKKFFLKPAKNIFVNDLGSNVDITWQSDLNSNTAWPFVFPVSTKNILKDLIAVSSVMHIGNKHNFDKINLKPGRYKVAIRSNKLWERGTFWGFQSEAWAISSQEFIVN